MKEDSRSLVEGYDKESLSHIVKDRDLTSLLKNSMSVEQASRNMWFFITNQIQRLKYAQNKLTIVNEEIQSPILEVVVDTVWPFEDAATMRCMNFHLISDNYEGF